MSKQEIEKQLKDFEDEIWTVDHRLQTRLLLFIVQLLVLSVSKPNGWYCACGHPNGINLAACALCGRSLGGPDNPIEVF